MSIQILSDRYRIRVDDDVKFPVGNWEGHPYHVVGGNIRKRPWLLAVLDLHARFNCKYVLPIRGLHMADCYVHLFFPLVSRSLTTLERRSHLITALFEIGHLLMHIHNLGFYLGGFNISDIGMWEGHPVLLSTTRCRWGNELQIKRDVDEYLGVLRELKMVEGKTESFSSALQGDVFLSCSIPNFARDKNLSKLPIFHVDPDHREYLKEGIMFLLEQYPTQDVKVLFTCCEMFHITDRCGEERYRCEILYACVFLSLFPSMANNANFLEEFSILSQHNNPDSAKFYHQFQHVIETLMGYPGRGLMIHDLYDLAQNIQQAKIIYDDLIITKDWDRYSRLDWEGLQYTSYPGAGVQEIKTCTIQSFLS